MLPRDHYLKQPFQDIFHFPGGFEKGGLSDIQARLIRKNGTLITAITLDEVSDPTTDDIHILKVIAGQSSPKNPVEQAWIKYLAIIKIISAENVNKTKPKAKTAKTIPETLSPENEIKAKPTKEQGTSKLNVGESKTPAEKPKAAVEKSKKTTAEKDIKQEKSPAKKSVAKK